MAAAIENIPNHCFNIHDKCGSWCQFKKDPDTYTHSVIGNGFTNPKLFDDLKDIFSSLAKKTSSFSAGTSSNDNESLNSMIVKRLKIEFTGCLRQGLCG